MSTPFDLPIKGVQEVLAVAIYNTPVDSIESSKSWEFRYMDGSARGCHQISKKRAKKSRFGGGFHTTIERPSAINPR